jgi:DNA-directed RNA polymerase subunit A'
MNMHVFQTPEARAEANNIMKVQEHILSPRYGGPIIGAIHDHITGAYLLTHKDTVFEEDKALQIIKRAKMELPEAKGEPWTGKEVFSLLLPDRLNLVYKAEVCRKCEECKYENCEYDAYVVISNGQLLQGVVDDKGYGSGSGKILDAIVKQFGPAEARYFLDHATKLAVFGGVMQRGFTTGTADEEIPKEAEERIAELLEESDQRVELLIQTYEDGELEALPGRSLRETLEMKIMQVLGEARDNTGVIAERYFTTNNSAVIMALTGARGSMLNLTQIATCVGQQAVRGGRINRGYIDRTLPHFHKGDVGAKASGFVNSSYKHGLDPLEFFFHAMGGREGLVDTAIRTAQSGYMQRRLVNALHDLSVHEDGTVRDNNGVIVQFKYGEDGINPAKSDYGKVADLDKLIEEMRLESNTAGK